MKFKVGDRVRLIDSGNVMSSDIGKEFTIDNIINKKINKFDGYNIQCSKNDYKKLNLNWAKFCENDVEHVKRKKNIIISKELWVRAIGIIILIIGLLLSIGFVYALIHFILKFW